MARTEAVGVDIGGSAIKGALVDLEGGALIGERHRVLTPSPSKPEAVADVVAEVVEQAGGEGPVGCTFPGIVRAGVIGSAANVDKSWIGVDADALFRTRTGRPFTVLNDADAAGLAEVAYGVAKDRPGVVLLLTLGTGIGSALFVDGHLVPNTELGHLELHGKAAEKRAAAQVRKDDGLSWKKWAGRVQEYLTHVEWLFSPDVIVIGGGVSRRCEEFFPYLDARAELVPAALRNEAGIIGAAAEAAKAHA